MGKVTIQRARKILGIAAKNISDEELEIEIKAAELLKELYFTHARLSKSKSNLSNKKNNGKT